MAIQIRARAALNLAEKPEQVHVCSEDRLCRAARTVPRQLRQRPYIDLPSLANPSEETNMNALRVFAALVAVCGALAIAGCDSMKSWWSGQSSSSGASGASDASAPRRGY